jgi:hypothetical protein
VTSSPTPKAQPDLAGPVPQQGVGVLAPSGARLGVALVDDRRALLGASLHDGGRRVAPPVALPFDALGGVPPVPGASLLGQAKVPPPPELSPDESPEEHAYRLAEAYRGAVRSRFRVEAQALKRGAITRSKFFKTIAASALMLQAHRIAPAAWAAWSCDKFIDMGNPGKPPPLSWVWSPKRISEHSGWFASEESSYAGGTVVEVRAATELRSRYMAMRAAIAAEGAWAAPKDVVARFFPGREWETSVAEARAATAQAAAELRRRAAAGQWIW